MTHRRPTDVLAETVEVSGQDVLDVGCGEGQLVRWLRGHGARAVGADCGAEMLNRALQADPEHPECYVDAPGQALPFDDQSFDVVVFSNSLHHIPTADMGLALAEAGRVLRPGGQLYVAEPEIDGPEDSVGYPVIDETEVRTAAQQALDGLDQRQFGPLRRFNYSSETVYESFDQWCDLVVGIDPGRASALDVHKDDLDERFHRLGERRSDGWVFTNHSLVSVATRS
ncbi:class I SAM-dependent methyltransferase [Candidatus Poriferisocius sp.]|uniref:class I SAM-dependent methyltransferase n=1 Tax=Candidatus Poriferisocius sp. TaxID=3101276 RepID=UPI003B02AD13